MFRPSTAEEAAVIVREQAATGRIVRPRGGGTKLEWGGMQMAESRRQKAGLPIRPAIELDTRGLDRIHAHNTGDFTAILDAGVSVAAAQMSFAQHGQMLALDPPLGEQNAATIGGILASNDSGPLRHRYGGIREFVLGATVILSDGTMATSGSTVIKNVAGYDLAKLFSGSFGTLGVIVRVVLRLHPLPANTASVVGTSNDPNRLAVAIKALARLPLEAEALDLVWEEGVGQLLLRFAGSAAAQRAMAAANHFVGLESVHMVDDDRLLWEQQRAKQRAPAKTGRCVLKVSGRPSDLPMLLRAAEVAGATVVSRAALGLSWITLPAGAVGPMRLALAPRACRVLDGARYVDDPWPMVEPGVLALMQRVKARFDPIQAFQPGTFAGGI